MNQLYPNYVHLSPEDSIEQLNLTNRSFNALIRADIRTVGETLQLVESGRLRTISGLGRKSILELKNKLAQVSILDHSELEVSEDVIPEQDHTSYSRKDSIEQLINLKNRSFNALTRAGIRTVGELVQLAQSGGLQTIPALGKKSILEIQNKLAQVSILNDSEVESNTDVITDPNNVHLSQEDSIEHLNLTNRSFNALTRAGIRRVGEVVQLVESGRLRTVPALGRNSILEIEGKLAQLKPEVESRARTNAIPAPNDIFLTRTDVIGKLSLTRRSFNSLRRANVRTVGEVLRLDESGELQTIRGLGSKCVLEIKERLAQVKILNASEVEAKVDTLQSPKISYLPRKQVVEKPTSMTPDLIESLAKENEIPGRVVTWQSQLVCKQLSRGLLHEDAIIAEKSIKDWIAEIEKIESNRIYEVLANILTSSLNICEEIEFLLNQIHKQFSMAVLLSRHGFEPKTLKQTGDELGISRERVRQIENELKDKVSSISNLKARPPLLRMQSALLIARDLDIEITYEGWTQRIRTSGLVGDWVSGDFAGTDVVEVIIAICNLLADCDIRWLQMPENLQYAIQLAMKGKPDVPAKFPHALETLPDEIKRLIDGHTKNSGGVYVKWLSLESGMELDATKDVLHVLGYRLLSGNWFVPKVIAKSLFEKEKSCLKVDVYVYSLEQLNLNQ